ncbi:hypothetical protein ACFVYG_32465 [Streptomyces sp. NPDC058256]|uniref:hypothetical protein n=1 Tax=Streptomyces sp. NPDC058256 TaxID=3346408 RepID=UPI0036F1468E
MSDQRTPLQGVFQNWLTDLGADAYALVSVAAGSDPASWSEAEEAPTAGETGIARAGVDLTRVETGIGRTGADFPRMALQEVTRGPQETLRRWLQRDDGARHLAIVGDDDGVLREYTPGELTAQLMHDPATDEAQLTHQLASWLYQRNADAPQGLELGWIAAAAAWTCHMRAFTSHPPASVLTQSLASAGEQDEATEELVISTGLKMAELFDRMERAYRPRAELVQDWHVVEALAGDVPALRGIADWLLDQIALRDAHAQQLRAVLEPDITDHQRDRQASEHLLEAAAPTLDEARTAHLGQARETVRAYTAAAYSGREQEAQQILDAFPVPARSLEASGPATAWRQNSATAQDAVDALAAQRAATTAEDSPDYFADPELLHAETSYLAAREGQLHLMHDALGRLAYPTPAPRDLPDELAGVAAAQTQRRIIEAFGTADRARHVLDGRISYLLQQPVPAHRRATTGAEADLLTAVRDALGQRAATGVSLDAEYIRIRLQEAMGRPVAPAASDRAAIAAHDQAHTQALAAGATTPGVQL